jgi:hypothetical protein
MTSPARTLLRFLVFSTLGTVCVRAEGHGLRARAVLLEARYCQDNQKRPMVLLLVGLDYQNTATEPAIMSYASQLVRYSVYLEPVDHQRPDRPLFTRKSAPRDRFDPRELDRASPNRGFFGIVQPGSTLRLQAVVPISLASLQKAFKRTHQRELELQVEMEMGHWLSGRKSGEEFAGMWRGHGRLQTENVVAERVPVRLEARDIAQACTTRID